MTISTERQTAVAATVGGHEITFETGKLAKQADGSVVVRSGETMVLATAQGRMEAREGAEQRAGRAEGRGGGGGGGGARARGGARAPPGRKQGGGGGGGEPTPRRRKAKVAPPPPDRGHRGEPPRPLTETAQLATPLTL